LSLFAGWNSQAVVFSATVVALHPEHRESASGTSGSDGPALVRGIEELALPQILAAASAAVSRMP
jgi:ABC-type polysaccharide transport system permease subunit